MKDIEQRLRDAQTNPDYATYSFRDEVSALLTEAADIIKDARQLNIHLQDRLDEIKEERDELRTAQHLTNSRLSHYQDLEKAALAFVDHIDTSHEECPAGVALSAALALLAAQPKEGPVV